jgi:hypothetical protein
LPGKRGNKLNFCSLVHNTKEKRKPYTGRKVRIFGYEETDKESLSLGLCREA